ncbi:DUF1294 domain-containing protein [Colwellia sp. BRX8-9]|uniref:DUF1294 domain-containing protein n=1 Tax=Colwellia sp. BRX8-9 TaxID=2759831 RepID=UPI0015F4A2DC|nr:DUF1294 domain-containing protein [Colwellia sp. BRX8-9]MBA6348335.1 cold shock and DUF1294 domain-containing protein [Colwellia sp. BRX8-9]
MRKKGKLIKWNADKAFGFIQPNGGGDQIFIHKTALENRTRIPQVNEVITFSLAKDNQGRYCAGEATFSGEKLKKKQANKVSKFSIYLAVLFLGSLSIAFFLNHIPKNLLLAYLGLSVVTFLAYWFDKSKAQRGAWRTQESTLHMFSLLGGWPGAAIAQQILRHKSQKREFRTSFWFTVFVNIGALSLLLSPNGNALLILFK